MKRHKFISRNGIVDRVDEIVRLCQNKIVLNIGMGGYIDNPEETRFWIDHLLPHSIHLRAVEKSRELVGLDINPTAIEAMQKALPGKYVQGDITIPNLLPELENHFDLVIFGEILDHLDNFHQAFSTNHSARSWLLGGAMAI